MLTVAEWIVAKVLIVEDEQVIALGLQQALLARDYQVAGVVDNARDALILAHDERPDLVLMDIHIRGPMDGIEAGCHIYRSGIPVIYVTAYSDPKTVDRAVESMPYGFITKPYRRAELYAVIQLALYKVRMEQVIQTQQEQLATHQEQLLALVTHEVRNPIATINAAVESLHILDRAIATPEHQQRFQRIASAVHTVQEVLDTALQQSRLAGTPDQAKAADLLAVTRKAIGLFTTEQQVRLKLTVRAADTLRVATYPELLQFALRNLIDNALRYSPASTPVGIVVELTRDGRRARWVIVDSGPGVAEPERERIFEQYFRGETGQQMAGLGLGLFIARHLIQKSGGSLDYRTSAGGGACFELALPTLSP